MEWPAKCSDLKPIESVLGEMVRHLYKYETQYECKSLADAISEALCKISVQCVRKLYESIPRRIWSVNEEKGCVR